MKVEETHEKEEFDEMTPFGGPDVELKSRLEFEKSTVKKLCIAVEMER